MWSYYVELAFKEWGPKLNCCMAVDCVSHGDSAVLNKGKVGWLIPWEDVARDIVCAIRDATANGEIAEDSPTCMIGHSMGGANAMYASVFDPSLISAAVVLDPVYGVPSLNAPMDLLANRMAKLSAAVYKNARDKFDSLEDFYKFTLKSPKFVGSTFNPRIGQDVADNMYTTDSNGAIQMKSSREQQAGIYFSAFFGMGNAATLLKRNFIPTLVAAGDVSDWNPPGSAQLLAEEILPNAQLKVIEGGGHNIFFIKPDDSFAAIKGFISQQYEKALSDKKKLPEIIKRPSSSDYPSYIKQVLDTSKVIRTKL